MEPWTTNSDEHLCKALASLKDFQKATVDHLFDLFTKQNRRRLLVADEVGLGKTIVAKGLIAKLIEKHNSITPYRVIYICSNQVLARSNVKKLQIYKNSNAEEGIDRITLLGRESSEISDPSAIGTVSKTV